MKEYKILAINPGSTSTKVAIYSNRTLIKELTLRHSSEELKQYANVMDQFEFRKHIITDAVKQAGIAIESLDAVIGRGGLVHPIQSGVYTVNEALKRDLLNSPIGEHASNLGGLIADNIASEIGIPAFIADPVVVDEMEDVARITGLCEIERKSIFHALNQKAIARLYAEEIGKEYEHMNLIVAHLGGGISVGAHRKGRVIDVNNALNGDGPFSPERAGTLPAGQLVELCFSGKYTKKEIDKMLCGVGGMISLANTNDSRDLLKAVEERGDKRAQLLLDALSYNISKCIGAMAVVLHGEVDAIIITGGIANNPVVCKYITDSTQFIAPVVIKPGENELEALAINALRVLEGKCSAQEYMH